LITGEGVRHSPPSGLKDRVTATIDQPSAEHGGNMLPSWLAPGAMGALAASLALMLILPSGNDQRIEDELIAGHIRSLQAEHLTDVRTSNRHLVKPWFNGKINFSPPVPELSAAGFPLAGGRLDYAGGHNIAAIVYRRRLHSINLFIWPATDGSQHSLERNGYALNEWSRNGLRYVAVSDISPAELDAFRMAFIQASDEPR
jgi:anti-sigma factor RsiW